LVEINEENEEASPLQERKRLSASKKKASKKARHFSDDKATGYSPVAKS